MVNDILQSGLTLGVFSAYNGFGYEEVPHRQWLTADSDPRNQSWATQHLIDYSRTAYRLTINIPNSYRKKLIRAIDYVKSLPEQAQRIVTGWDGSSNWYIYQGSIPAKWIVGYHKMK